MDAKALVGPEARRYLEEADRCIALPQAELGNLEPPPVPHWDAKLRLSKKAR